jgi:PAS domain S-box-containing protein
MDAQGVITDFNDAAERLTGYSKEALIGKDHFGILHGTEAKDACPLFAHSVQGAEAFEVESKLRRADDEVISISSIGYPMNDEGKPVY